MSGQELRGIAYRLGEDLEQEEVRPSNLEIGLAVGAGRERRRERELRRRAGGERKEITGDLEAALRRWHRRRVKAKKGPGSATDFLRELPRELELVDESGQPWGGRGFTRRELESCRARVRLVDDLQGRSEGDAPEAWKKYAVSFRTVQRIHKEVVGASPTP